MSTLTTITDSSAIQQWLTDKLDTDTIREQLQQKGLTEEEISHSLQAFKKARYARRQFAGFIYLGVGAFLGFISCVLTLVNPIPALYDYILYGLTSIAVTLMIVGLYQLFE